MQTLQAARDVALTQAFDRRSSDVQRFNNFFVQTTGVSFEQDAGKCQFAGALVAAAQ